MWSEVVKMARELALALEADKHRGQPELLEVRLLVEIERLEGLPKTRCSVCGGTDVEHAMWVEVNGERVSEPFGTWNYGDNCWCNDCREHHPLVDPVDQEVAKCARGEKNG